MFQLDLAFGKKYEREAVRILQQTGEGQLEWAPEGAFKPWDFKWNDVPYEVKSDRYGYTRHSMFIEYECSGKDSGIMTTEAKDWFYFMESPNKKDFYAFRIPVERIRAAISKPNVRTVSGGDGGRVRGYIVPRSEFEDCFISSCL